MNAQDAIDWFEDAATRLKMLSGFFRNIDHFKDEKSNIKPDQLFMVLDEPRGTLSGQQNENIRDNQKFGFFIFKWCEDKDWKTEDQIYDEAKTAALKIMGKAYYERKNYQGLFKLVNIDSVDYMKAGPEVDNYFGCFCSFTVSDNANDQLSYNPDNWDPPV